MACGFLSPREVSLDEEISCEQAAEIVEDWRAEEGEEEDEEEGIELRMHVHAHTDTHR